MNQYVLHGDHNVREFCRMCNYTVRFFFAKIVETSIQSPADMNFRTFWFLRRVCCHVNQVVEFGLKGRRLHFLCLTEKFENSYLPPYRTLDISLFPPFLQVVSWNWKPLKISLIKFNAHSVINKYELNH